MEGLVISKNADLFMVECGNKIYNLKPSGKTKARGIFVGDRVEFEDNIISTFPRKNLLIRPPLANIDRIFIVVSFAPKPDFVLVDKLIIYCLINNIEPNIVINKIDICDKKFIERIEEDYGHSYNVIKVSAKCRDVKRLKEKIDGICVLAGQSAVGKSSIINVVLDKDENVGELSKKIERGKQTTRIIKLFKYKDSYIADTAGFSLLDLSFVANINERELSSYYPEFLEARAECKYRSCLHESGDMCGVLNKVREGKISRNRYENYLKILQELKNSKKF